ncbi:hypothetical protein [Streptomyces montanisoli]|uniref:Uncharacterized protein n=1 Tax=Streptomyces montanisoli TaxID=2798581 RepID=A0A940MFE7_9ACTN|nr:hypothetical protein [Streptomyces montanisoli]MBP0459005.1 hypothetical protein [Streptomyces montanisoli]
MTSKGARRRAAWARTGVLLGLWVLVMWGSFLALRGIGEGGLADHVVCPGTNLGPEGEENPRVRPGDRCYLPGGNKYRGYNEQWAFQRKAHDKIVIGVRLLGGGALGIGVLVVQRRLAARWKAH